MQSLELFIFKYRKTAPMESKTGEKLCFSRHVTIKLSSSVMEIPYDAYTTLIQNVFGCSILCQEYPKLIG